MLSFGPEIKILLKQEHICLVNANESNIIFISKAKQ